MRLGEAWGWEALRLGKYSVGKGVIWLRPGTGKASVEKGPGLERFGLEIFRFKKFFKNLLFKKLRVGKALGWEIHWLYKIWVKKAEV